MRTASRDFIHLVIWRPQQVLEREKDLAAQFGEWVKAASQPGKALYQAWYFYLY